ncbi:tbc1 domain family member whacked [Anaeramoeba ignava]|uniref:Tbc1 domain family member whacked n=1 Tax=Anaeramoeba ignava TaxID=1746090 RepID=A0A9Q0LNX9_ANAIG|nr:tbc1 domain family member whacked [Anaeramoeba ignava]
MSNLPTPHWIDVAIGIVSSDDDFEDDFTKSNLRTNQNQNQQKNSPYQIELTQTTEKKASYDRYGFEITKNTDEKIFLHLLSRVGDEGNKQFSNESETSKAITNLLDPEEWNPKKRKYTPSKYTPSKNFRKPTKKEIKKELSRADKWIHMFANWEVYTTKKIKILDRRILKGIPDRVRGEAWKKIVGSDQLQKSKPNLYEQNITARNLTSEKIILKDLDRTFPEHQLFVQRQIQQKLYNVLRALANYSPETGYCQGMSFIGGLLLLYMEEKEAFYFFVKLLDDYHMKGIFQAGFPLLQYQFEEWKKMLRSHCPKIDAKLEENNVEPSFYAMKWFMTIYSNIRDFSGMAQVWENYLFRKNEFLFGFTLSLMKLSEKKILKMDPSYLLQQLQDIPNDFPISKVLEVYKKIKLSKDEKNRIQNLANNWLTQNGNSQKK